MRGKVHYRRKHRAARAKYERRVATKLNWQSARDAGLNAAGTATGSTPAAPNIRQSFPKETESEIFAAPDVNEQLKSAIDCYFCGMRADAVFPPDEGGFDDFKKLAAHVLHCPWAPLPKPRTEFYIEAANLLAANRIADARMKGETNMTLPAPKSTGQPTGGSTPTLPFLKVDMLTQNPQEVTIKGVDTNGTGFNDIVVKLVMDGKGYFWGLKASNPCYGILFDKLGADETKWEGRSFTVLQEWNKFYEKNFIGIGKVLPAERAKK